MSKRWRLWWVALAMFGCGRQRNPNFYSELMSSPTGDLVSTSERKVNGDFRSAIWIAEEAKISMVARASFDATTHELLIERLGFAAELTDLTGMFDMIQREESITFAFEVEDMTQMVGHMWFDQLVRCGRNPVSCQPTWSRWQDDPDPTLADVVNLGSAQAHSLLEKAASMGGIGSRNFAYHQDQCSVYPAVAGDHTCTSYPDSCGFGLGRDLTHCCAGPGSHDDCYYNCPLPPGSPPGKCTANGGQTCISRCNNLLYQCCRDNGSTVQCCAKFYAGTTVGGGDGENGCGKGRGLACCKRHLLGNDAAQLPALGVGSSYDATCNNNGKCYSCMCEKCKAIYPDDKDIQAFDCSKCECPTPPAGCTKEGVYDHGGLLSGPCYTDGTADFYRVCTKDANGCLDWKEIHCGREEVCKKPCKTSPTPYCAATRCKNRCEIGTFNCIARFPAKSGYRAKCGYDRWGCRTWVPDPCPAGTYCLRQNQSLANEPACDRGTADDPNQPMSAPLEEDSEL
jgi:hypothetical protein